MTDANNAENEAILLNLRFKLSKSFQYILTRVGKLLMVDPYCGYCKASPLKSLNSRQ